MARLKTAQPNSSLRKIAVVVATAVSGMSVYAQAAVQPKEETITVTAAPAAQESAWGPAATIAARQSATATKTDTPIQKVPQSISVVTAEEMALHQPKSVELYPWRCRGHSWRVQYLRLPDHSRFRR